MTSVWNSPNKRRCLFILCTQTSRVLFLLCRLRFNNNKRSSSSSDLKSSILAGFQKISDYSVQNDFIVPMWPRTKYSIVIVSLSCAVWPGAYFVIVIYEGTCKSVFLQCCFSRRELYGVSLKFPIRCRGYSNLSAKFDI